MAFARHHTALYSYARRRTYSAEDAEEAVSSIYLTAWRKLDAMPKEPETRRWLYAVARRVLANQRRSNSRARRLQQQLGRQRESNPTLDADAGVDDALSHLRPCEREVLRLSSWERLSYVEASARLHCTPNAYAIRLHRARLAFRVALAECATRTQRG